MKAKSTKVQCVFCRQLLAPNALARHFLACQKKKLKDEAELELMAKANNMKAKGDNRVFVIKVFSPYASQYWLIIEANAKATLKKIDAFLRNIWLECCGHLSRFDIEGIAYEFPIDPGFDYYGEKPKSMNVQLGKVLSKDLLFDHQYDFGSTTYLKLKVVGERIGQLSKKSVQLLDRNLEPGYNCMDCNQQATLICGQCEEVSCEACSEEHACGEEMFLPLVNSPRTGVCGYTGGE